MHKRLFVVILGALFLVGALAGCNAKVPKDAMAFSPQTLQDRQLQSRRFDSGDELSLIAACGGVLQDLGYAMEESDAALGFMLGSKTREATDGGQIAMALLVAALGGGNVPVDNHQIIRASIVTRPIFQKKEGEAQHGLLSEEKIVEVTKTVHDALYEYLNDSFSAEVSDKISVRLAEKTAESLQKDLEIISLIKGTVGSTIIRVTFQRIIINTQGQISALEYINSAEVYQDFFNKLSQSVFLEAHKI